MKMNYSIFGLGKLGASMAAAIASRGFNVIGVDVSQHAVDLVNAGRAPVQETNLEELIAANRQRIKATLDPVDAILHSDVTFVIVPTPSDSRGAFSLKYAKSAFREIGRALAQKAGYHLVVLTSTVLPGSSRYGLLPILEKQSGKVCGKDFGLCYSPEFIALGSVIHDFLNPDFNLIGEFDTQSGDLLQASYTEIMANNPPVRRMSLENAELTKISLNTYVTTKITFANMLAELCSRIPGGNIDVVSNALGCDTRIGRKYLTGGLGFGGPCFPRDNVALGFFAKSVGYDAGLAIATDRMNRSMAGSIANHLSSFLHPGSAVAILGLAYKPYSHVIEESQAIYLAKELHECGYRIIGYDPLANENARAELKDKALIVDSVKACLEQADAVLITTPDPEFRALQAGDFPQKNPPVLVYDCWRILLEKLEGSPNILYIPLGIGIDNRKNEERLKMMWSETEGE